MSLPDDFAQDLWVRKTFSAAGHTLLIYDYFLSLNDEISYIWDAPWTVIKVIFLINRYGNLIGQTFIRLEEAGLLTNDSQEFCKIFALITTTFMLLSSISVHILVLVRARVIWGPRKRVTKILILTYCIVQLGGAMWTLYRAHLSYFRYLDLAKVCVGVIASYAWLSFLGNLILDTVLFVLTMRSLWKYSREFQCLYPSGLLHILVRDAMMFFIVSIFTDVLTIISWTANSDNPKYFIAKGFASPLLSVAGQRLVLNIRSSKIQTYTMDDLNRVVDRQLEAFAGSSIALGAIVDRELGRETTGNMN